MKHEPYARASIEENDIKKSLKARWAQIGLVFIIYAKLF